MKALLAIDDAPVATFVSDGLRADGHTAETANGAADALLKARKLGPDVVAVDVLRRGGQELQLLRALRDVVPGVPIVALVERGSVAVKNQALDAGASACLGKPFSIGELVAQVRILGRREGLPTELRFEDLSLDLYERKARRAGREIPLTPREYSLLEVLLKRPGQVVTRHQISRYAWSWDSAGSDTNVVDVYINYLRNKVDAGFGAPLIHTIRGEGYVLRADRGAAAWGGAGGPERSGGR